MTDECPPADYPRLLDVGCGTGVLAGRLAAQRLQGNRPRPLGGHARRPPRAIIPSVEAIRGSGDELPFEDSSFDVVVTVAALHHIADPDAVRATLAEMARVTRPGGRIVVWDHNPRNPYWKRLMARVPQDDGSERLIPEAEVLGGAARRRCPDDPLGSARPGPGLRATVAARTPSRESSGLAERTPGLRRLCAHNVVARDQS